MEAIEEGKIMLRPGRVGDNVRKLQERLKEPGFYSGRIDGVFGGATLSAVKRFQAVRALKKELLSKKLCIVLLGYI